ncbi:MAG: hypothetical protein MUP22_13175 [Desulfobacterales bacterium]|nr:hypothetical protein [Desulfobacterales bacterium]
MRKFEILAGMMMTPGNKEIWLPYLNENFERINKEVEIEKILEYLDMKEVS